jgi:hypothetical protein
MATFLSGVTDYIPQVQPFQPNLNLYSNVLQQKQTKYDSNWKAVNNVYSQFFYADLTNAGSQEKRDTLMKNIEFDLRKVAGLDLSLDQNIKQAKQVFTPFYEDKNLMKDIAWTKNTNSQLQYAEGLKKSTDEKESKRYWNEGVRDIQYKIQDFKEADAENLTSFANVSYTPYVNVQDKAMEIAKKADLSIETVDFSPDGRWIIKNKNGEKLKEPLAKLFYATLANDPGVQAVYQTLSTVKRRDYADINASSFGGDSKKAEIKYLTEQLENQAIKAQQAYQKVNESDISYTSRIKELEKQIANNTARPGAEAELQSLKNNKQINDVSLSRWDKHLSELKGSSSSTSNTNNGFRNPYGDLETLRRKVDGAVANDLLGSDLQEAAETLAYKNFKQDVTANPYKVMEIKHSQAKELQKIGIEARERLQKDKIHADRVTNQYKSLIDNGVGFYNEKSGEFEYYPGFDNSVPVSDVSGKSTDEMSYGEIRNTGNEKLYNTLHETYFDQMIKNIGSVKDNNHLTTEHISALAKGTGMVFKDYQDMKEKLQDPSFINKQKPEAITKLWKNYDALVTDDGFRHYLPQGFEKKHGISNAMIQSTELMNKAYKEWEQTSQKDLSKSLKQEGYFFADYLFNKDGKMRSEDDYYRAVINRKEISDDWRFSAYKEYIKTLNTDWKETKNPKEREAITKKHKDFVKDYGWIMEKRPLLKRFNADVSSDVDFKLFDVSLKGGTSYKQMIKHIENNKSSIVQNHPIFPAYGYISGNSFFSSNGAEIIYNKNAPNSAGGRAFREATLNIKALDIDGINIAFSTQGATVIGIEKFKEANETSDGTLNNLSKNFLDYLLKSKHDVRMIYDDIAANQLGKEVTTFKPHIDDIDAWAKTIEASGFGENKEALNKYITDIKANGLSIIAKDGTFTHELAKNSKVSPFELSLSTLKKDEVYVHKDSGNPDKNMISFQKRSADKNDYAVTIQFEYFDSKENKYKQHKHSVNPNTTTSGKLDKFFINSLDLFDKVNALENIYKTYGEDAYMQTLNSLFN